MFRISLKSVFAPIAMVLMLLCTSCKPAVSNSYVGHSYAYVGSTESVYITFLVDNTCKIVQFLPSEGRTESEHFRWVPTDETTIEIHYDDSEVWKESLRGKLFVTARYSTKKDIVSYLGRSLHRND